MKQTWKLFEEFSINHHKEKFPKSKKTWKMDGQSISELRKSNKSHERSKKETDMEEI
jgi:hypothetical protein